MLPIREFRVSTSDFLRGVSLRGRGFRGVGIDERVEGASGKLPRFSLLDVNQVDQVAPVHPLVELHSGVALFDDPDQAPGEGDAVRAVSTAIVISVDQYRDRLIHPFSLERRPSRDWTGGPGRTPRLHRP